MRIPSATGMVVPGSYPFANHIMDFFQRAPSPSWEMIAFPECPQCNVAAWYRPANLPNGVMVSVADQTRAVYPFMMGALFSARRLMTLLGVNPALVSTWWLNGAAYPAMQGTNPQLDHPIPLPPPGAELTIMFDLTPQPVPGYQPQPQYPTASPVAAAVQPLPAALTGNAPADADKIFEAIEKDWAACQESLKDLTRLRKQLVDLQSRLKSLNRDLNSDERMFSSPQDKKDWLDARRWLREGQVKTTMLVKSHDIGDISDAGRGRQVEEIYVQFVKTRTPFEGMAAAQQQFVEYRKMVTTLQSKMSSAYSSAGVAAERKAQSVLKRIQAKVRKGNSRKNFMDVISDR